MLKVTQLTKTYNTTKALDEVSFEIEQGDITGFLGPNGAGKTTTMRILTGYLIPDTGKVTFDDKSISQQAQFISRQIGYLPENNPLYGNLRVDEFLTYAAKLKAAVDKKELSQIAERCGIKDVMTKTIDTLSKGYRQRVGLAKALIGNPKYLILDEPTEGLDPNQKEAILELIKEIAKDKTIIFSSHVLSEVKQIATDVIIINRGRIVAQGNSDQLIRKHLKDSTITLRTDAPAAQLQTKLKGIKTVTSINRVSKGREKFSQYQITCIKPEETSLEIFKNIARNRWNLVELHSESQGLEELFKQLTK